MLPEKLKKSTCAALILALLGTPLPVRAQNRPHSVEKCENLTRTWAKPFWKSKKRVQKRLAKGELFVSVTSDDRIDSKSQKELEILHLKGVGWVAASPSSVRTRMYLFEQLKTLAPDNLREIRFDPKADVLFVHGMAMGWHAKMHMKLCREDLVSGESRLHFHVIRGNFQGMEGFFEVVENPKDLGRRRTEFSMTGYYESEKLPLPSFLLSFGLETVLRVVAIRMRKFFEAGKLHTAPELKSGGRQHERQTKISSTLSRAPFRQLAGR